ncbi:hypothetical protein ACFVHB_36005 [Kitasatospora sp. NPDC127111]|uniref:hypothetical protein n=1 Tax=Kitasatospora sp. NPDC127111 TaxID=3345363 RepID=UPI003629AD8E
MTPTCQCGPATINGPGMLAAHHAYQRQIRAERTAGGRQFRSRRTDFHPMNTLSFLAGLLDGDGAVRLEVASAAEELERPLNLLVDELRWLADGRRFLHTEGFADGLTKIWLNPAVAVDGGCDPRPLAARHRFPYPLLADGGLSAPEPVRFLEYSAPLWDEVYFANRDMFVGEVFPNPDCRACFPVRLRSV